MSAIEKCRRPRIDTENEVNLNRIFLVGIVGSRWHAAIVGVIAVTGRCTECTEVSRLQIDGDAINNRFRELLANRTS